MKTLYFAPGACSLAVHIVLEWIGAPYDAIKVDQHDPAYRRINPAGAVPALDFGGSAPLTRCSAILTYLAQTHPQANLLDDTSPENAAILHKWAAFLTGDLHPAFFPVFMPGRYTVSQNKQALAEVKAAGLALVRTKLALLEAQMQGHSWILADKRTIIDPTRHRCFAGPFLLCRTGWANTLPAKLTTTPWRPIRPSVAFWLPRPHDSRR